MLSEFTSPHLWVHADISGGAGHSCPNTARNTMKMKNNGLEAERGSHFYQVVKPWCYHYEAPDLRYIDIYGEKR